MADKTKKLNVMQRATARTILLGDKMMALMPLIRGHFGLIHDQWRNIWAVNKKFNRNIIPSTVKNGIYLDDWRKKLKSELAIGFVRIAEYMLLLAKCAEEIDNLTDVNLDC